MIATIICIVSGVLVPVMAFILSEVIDLNLNVEFGILAGLMWICLQSGLIALFGSNHLTWTPTGLLVVAGGVRLIFGFLVKVLDENR